MAISLIEKINQQTLLNLIQSSHSFYQVLKKIGYKQIYDKRNIEKVKNKCDEYNINYSHLREDRQLETIICKECGKEKYYKDFYEYNNKIQHICLECKKIK